MDRELTNLSNINDCNKSTVPNFLNNISNVAVDLVIRLHENGLINDELLKHIAGVKNVARNTVPKNF